MVSKNKINLKGKLIFDTIGDQSLCRGNTDTGTLHLNGYLDIWNKEINEDSM